MFKKLREKISKSISGLSEGAKTGLSIYAAPVFPAIHAAADFPAFKEHWTTTVDEYDGVRPATRSEMINRVLIGSLMTAVWTAAATGVANIADNAYTDKEHAQKIDVVVSSIACKPTQEEGRAFCGSGTISATSGFLPWVGKDAANVVVVAEKKVQQGFNEHGLALNVCESKQYATFPIDQGFVANDDETPYVAVSTNCLDMALER